MKDLMQNDRSDDRIQRSFRRGFATYTQHARVQADVAKELAVRVARQIPRDHCKHALEFGCGTGHLTRALLKQLSVERLTLNDLVPEAREVCTAVASHMSDVSFVPGRFPDVLPEGPFDLIASASTVQWIPDHAALLSRVSEVLTTGGILALSGFGSHQYRELVSLGSTASAPGYRDADDWRSIMPADLEIVSAHQERHVLTFASPRDVLKHLRQTGVNGRAKTGWTRSKLAAFEAEYEHRFGADKGVTLTYDPVWIIARKRG